MDKKFYGGTIKSYDPLEEKHVILYDDGDVEILRLKKERWKLIDKGCKSTKKMNPSSLEKVNGKQSSSKPLKRGQKRASNSKNCKDFGCSREQRGTLWVGDRSGFAKGFEIKNGVYGWRRGNMVGLDLVIVIRALKWDVRGFNF